jgi:tetratricopeptide (TPR) repeat protein
MTAAVHRVLPALALAVGAVASPLRAQHEGHGAHPAAAGRDTVAVRLAASARLGDLAFANSGAPAAQAAFLQGVALLHNFEYDAAGEAFRAAQRADAGFALPYWLEAFSHSRIVWGLEDLAASRAALARLGPTPAARLAKAPTPRERAFGAAFEALYAEGTLAQRTRAFADSMRRVAAADAGDHEAAVFAAIATMTAASAGAAASPAERDAMMREASGHAERVFAANPRHPGAAHFVIHTNDDPVHAARALPAARAYAQIAPASEHAQHMPSHVFVQLGYWDEAAAANVRAWNASRTEVAERKAPLAALSWHTLSWLEYAYLQQGRRRDARALLDSARTFLARLAPGNYTDARFAVPLMEYLYASNTGQWDAWTGRVAAAVPRAGAQQREVGFTRNHAYWTALAAVQRGPSARADSLVRLLRDAVGDGAPRSIAVGQVEALQLSARGQRDSAIAALTRLAVRHDSQPPLGPPFLVPTAELLGGLLLDAGRPAEAAAAYERALRLCPNRARSLLGLARARAKAGDRAGASTAYGELLAIWDEADADLPELAEARRGVE